MSFKGTPEQLVAKLRSTWEFVGGEPTVETLLSAELAFSRLNCCSVSLTPDQVDAILGTLPPERAQAWREGQAELHQWLRQRELDRERWACQPGASPTPAT